MGGEYVSFSMLSNMKCPRLWKYMYIDRLYPREKSIPLIAGSIWHDVCMHGYFNGVKKKQILKNISKEYKMLIKTNRSTRQEYTQELIKMEAVTRAAFKGYVKLYARDEFKVIATEKRFAVPIVKGVVMGGSIDRLVKNDNGELWIKEYKFTSRIDQDTVVRTEIDHQVSIYFWAAQKLGLKPKGIIYDMTKKPYLKPHQDEVGEEFEERLTQDYKLRPEFYFKREELYRDKHQIADMVDDIERKITRLLYMKEHMLYDRETTHCLAYNTLCSYFPLCANPGSAKNKILFTSERS